MCQFWFSVILSYSTLISRNLNFADSSLQSFRWINFAVPFALPEVLSKLPHLQCVSWYMHAHTLYYHAHKLIWQLVRLCELKSEASWWLQPHTKWRLWSVAITYTQLAQVCGMPRLERSCCSIHGCTYIATLSSDNLTWCSRWARLAGLVWVRTCGHWKFSLNNFRGNHYIRENSKN